jgi:hypothetical protein
MENFRCNAIEFQAGGLQAVHGFAKGHVAAYFKGALLALVGFVKPVQLKGRNSATVIAISTGNHFICFACIPANVVFTGTGLFSFNDY